MFTQDKNDDFDWTRHSAATRDTKYTPNTGPAGDRSGSKQGKYFEKSKPDPSLYCSLSKVQGSFMYQNCSKPYNIIKLASLLFIQECFSFVNIQSV